MIISRLERLLAGAATLAGLLAWAVFLHADLVLSHYDAKAHLVVARRVIDNLTPGWQQVGAVWLPLPHLIQILPMQVDALYRTGASGSLVSIACFGLTAYAFARLILAATGSPLGAVASTAVLVLNPNLLYLQSTPMTEPLLLAVTAFSVLWLFEWVRSGSDRLPTRLAVVLFAATWTRYEAWPVLAAAGAITLFAMWRRGTPWPSLLQRAARLALWPAVAVLIFVINSRITVGSWFVSGGFYVPDPAYEGKALRSLVALWWGTHQMSGYGIEIIALAGAAYLVVQTLRRSGPLAGRVELLLPLSMFAAGALPFYGFYEGHPFRIRYMIPLVAACALSSGLAVGLARRRFAPLVLLLIVGSALIESPPWSRQAPMLVEAQWDRPASVERQRVSACLAREYRGEKILASMGSLAHYMQELSWDGFNISDFINEGNGAIWNAALETRPALHAGWMLVEEQAEGGDVLAQRIRGDSGFVVGMTRVCDGGGVALYRRTSSLRASSGQRQTSTVSGRSGARP